MKTNHSGNHHDDEIWERLVVYPCTLKILVADYKISRRTLSSWLKRIKNELGPKDGYQFNIPQVTMIYETYGIPPVIKQEILRRIGK